MDPKRWPVVPPYRGPDPDCLVKMTEIVDGVRELPPAPSDHGQIYATDLAIALRNHVEQFDLGWGGTHFPYALNLPVDRRRRVDVSFVLYSRWPKERGLNDDEYWDATPSFCCEFVAPAMPAVWVRTRVDEFLRSGVDLFWTAYPGLKVVDAFGPNGAMRSFGMGDTLDCGDAVPGFQIPVAKLFSKWL